MPSMVGGVCMTPLGKTRFSSRYVPWMLGPSANTCVGRQAMVIIVSNSKRIGFKAVNPFVGGV